MYACAMHWEMLSVCNNTYCTAFVSLSPEKLMVEPESVENAVASTQAWTSGASFGAFDP